MDFDLSNILLYGFHRTTYDVDKFGIDTVEFDREMGGVCYPSSIPPVFKAAYDTFLDETESTLKEYYSIVTFLPPHSKTSLESYVAVWDGVDSASQHWHNDALEGGDIFALLYFDDMFCDGAIHFQTPTSEVEILPKRGDLVFVSNLDCFMHKAQRSRFTRRLAHATFICSM